jgi:short-subunit dehydrogenase
MVKDKGGVILNMGSTNGLMGYPWYASYNASKAGVIELTPLHGPGTGAQS